MKSQTHFAATAILTPAVFFVSAGWIGLDYPLFVAVAFLAGAKAPDWLELRAWVFGRRFSIIEHRTITHTWWLWVLFAALSWLFASPFASALLIAFALSCLLHIAMDSLTPMGVPLWHPYGRRRRINLGWLSRDLGFLAALLAASLAFWKLASI